MKEQEKGDKMSKLHAQYEVFRQKQEKLLAMKNEKTDFYNGIYDRGWDCHPHDR